MYSRTVTSLTAPTGTQKYLRARRCCPQCFFCNCGNSSCKRLVDRPLMDCTSFAGAETCVPPSMARCTRRRGAAAGLAAGALESGEAGGDPRVRLQSGRVDAVPDRDRYSTKPARERSQPCCCAVIGAQNGHFAQFRPFRRDCCETRVKFTRSRPDTLQMALEAPTRFRHQRPDFFNGLLGFRHEQQDQSKNSHGRRDDCKDCGYRGQPPYR